MVIDHPKYQGVIPDDLEDLKNVDDSVTPNPGDVLIVESVTASGRPIWRSGTPSGGGGGVTSVNARAGVVTGLAEVADVAAAQAYSIDRAHHTGTQAESTVTGLVADLAAKETPAEAQAKADAAQAFAIQRGNHTGTQPATTVSVNPSGLAVITTTNVQAALAELDAAFAASPSSPTGPAGGMLTGTYPNPDVAANSIDGTQIKATPGVPIPLSALDLASDGAAGVASLRTLGTGSQQAAAGNDARFSTIGAQPGEAFKVPVADQFWTTMPLGRSSTVTRSDDNTSLTTAATTAGRLAHLGGAIGSGGAFTNLNGTMYFERWILPACTIIGLSCEIIVGGAGVAGTTIVMAIYDHSHNTIPDFPGAPQVSGSVAGDGTTGWRDLTISYAHPGGLLYVAFVVQNSSAQALRVRAKEGTTAMPSNTSSGSAGPFVGLSGVTGALPTNPAFTFSQTIGPVLKAKIDL